MLEHDHLPPSLVVASGPIIWLMPLKPTGHVFESGHSFFARVRPAPGKKRAVKLSAATGLADAQERAALMAQLIGRLRDAGKEAMIDKMLEQAASLPRRELPDLRHAIEGYCDGLLELSQDDTQLSPSMTVREFGEAWTSGAIARHFPDHVRAKKSVRNDIDRLGKHVYPVVGVVRLQDFKLDDAQLVMRSLDRKLAPASRRHVAQLLSRMFRLAVYPCRLIERSPVPPGFLPKAGPRKLFPYLYPDEEAQLMACTEVQLPMRLLFGLMAREGMRREEAASLTWSQLDLERGIVTLEEHKTAHVSGARAWKLGDDVRRALTIWRKHFRPHSTIVVCYPNGHRIGVNYMAQAFREALQAAGVTRGELYTRSSAKGAIRAHDLRATFVTLSLAIGRSQEWITDRTGHEDSNSFKRYKRTARSAEDLGLGWLSPLDEAIPELATKGGNADKPGSKGDSGSSPNVANGNEVDMRGADFRSETSPINTDMAAFGSSYRGSNPCSGTSAEKGSEADPSGADRQGGSVRLAVRTAAHPVSRLAPARLPLPPPPEAVAQARLFALALVGAVATGNVGEASELHRALGALIERLGVVGAAVALVLISSRGGRP